FHSRRGLIALVSLRKSLSKYLKRKDIEGYKKLIATLGIRG
ncbi:MAG: 30S ribosomal protein S15, partial [Anaplasmataceae bacterium]|nr:30S ribosomal protein S15 [Anaplasmataceae bacterium]